MISYIQIPPQPKLKASLNSAQDGSLKKSLLSNQTGLKTAFEPIKSPAHSSLYVLISDLTSVKVTGSKWFDSQIILGQLPD